MLINLSQTEYTTYLQKESGKTRIDKCMCLHREEKKETAQNKTEKGRTRIMCP